MNIDPIIWLYAGFGVFVIIVMAVDLALTGRSLVITPKRALAWTAVCVSLALAFLPALYKMYDAHWLGLGLDHATGEVKIKGGQAAALFFQGWLLEYSLSVDNLFVFALIFQHFRVPKEHQHRVLAWGIIATLILRGVFILLGAVLIQRFHFLLYIAGAFLLYTAFKMLAGKDEEFDADRSRTVRFVRRLIPVTSDYHADRFFVRAAGGLSATPMFLVLVVLNIVDIVFAVDSIPAIFGITRDSFLVFTSNVFAVLGLRALYFVLAHMMDKFRYLKVSLAVILGFVGVKMLTEELFKDHIAKSTMTGISLAFIVTALALGIWFSLRSARRPPRPAGPELDPAPDE